MSRESDWTIDTLREYFQRQFEDSRRMLDERYATQTKALDAAFVATERRFEGVNEFRAQLADQAQNFMTRQEAGVRLDALSEKLDAETSRTQEKFSALELNLTSRLDLIQGHDQGSTKTTYSYFMAATIAISIAAVIVTIIFLRH